MQFDLSSFADKRVTSTRTAALTPWFEKFVGPIVSARVPAQYLQLKRQLAGCGCFDVNRWDGNLKNESHELAFVALSTHSGD
jgi:hypothetical protein